MSDKQSPIAVVGSLIRKKRKEVNLSQRDLAEGICSQGMISHIERNNLSPNLKIVADICSRLNLNFEKILKRRINNHTRLSIVENAILANDYQKASDELNLIERYQLEYRIDRNRYDCYQGLLELHLYRNYNEALICLMGLVTGYNARNSFYKAWSLAALNLALFKVNGSDIPINMTNQARTILQNLDLNDISMPLLTRCYIDIMMLYSRCQKHDEVVAVGQEIQSYSINQNSMCNLSMINLLLGRAFNCKEEYQKATKHLENARAISQIYSDHKMLRLINDEVQKLKA